MPDRDTVIKGLEPIIGCAKQEKWGAWFDTLEDALALLKEQEAVAIEWKCGFPHCPVCGQMLPEGDAVRFCLHCGRSVKWE